MVKTQLVSLVNLALQALGHEVSPPADEQTVEMLEGTLQTSLELLAENKPSEELVSLRLKVSMYESVENNNVSEVVKLLNTKEQRITELEGFIKLQSEHVMKLDAELKKTDEWVKLLETELKAWNEAKLIAEAMRRAAKGERAPTPIEQEPQDLADNFKVFTQALDIVPQDALWEQIGVRRDKNRFTVFFNGAYYEANRNACYGFLGRIRARAVSRKHKAWFDKGYLVVQMSSNGQITTDI
jgi:hypothetical protein